MKYFKTYEAYRRGVNGVGSLKNSLAALKRQNIRGRYADPEELAKAIHNEYEAITGEKYEDEVQMSMDDAIADIVSHFKLDGPEFMAAWDRTIKESTDTLNEAIEWQGILLKDAMLKHNTTSPGGAPRSIQFAGQSYAKIPKGTFLIGLPGGLFAVNTKKKFALQLTSGSRTWLDAQDKLKDGDVGGTNMAPEFSKWKQYLNESMNEAITTKFFNASNAKNGDLFYSKRHGLGIKKDDNLYLFYAWEGEPKLGKVYKTDKLHKHLGPATPQLIKTYYGDSEKEMADYANKIQESYAGNLSDMKYDIELAVDNLGFSPKALKSVKKKGKGYEVRMSSYMNNKDTWERIGTDIGADLVDFKPGSVNVGIYERVNEARNKKVTKQMWRKMSDDKRFDALLSVVKDPDDAEKYVEFDWNDLPSGFERDMTLYEGRINRKQADNYGKKLKKKVSSVNWAKVANHDGEIKLFIDYSKFADRAQLKKAGEELGLTYRSDGRVSNRPGLNFKRGDKMVGGGGMLGIGNNWMVFVKE